MSTQPPERDSMRPKTAASSGRAAAVEPSIRSIHRAPQDTRAKRRWSSLQLLGDQAEIEIAHADSVYRLRVTSLGKLILTK